MLYYETLYFSVNNRADGMIFYKNGNNWKYRATATLVLENLASFGLLLIISWFTSQFID